MKKLLRGLLLFVIALGLVGCKPDEPQGPIELDTTLTESTPLTASYSGKNFITDGIGEVTLNRSVDGDTISVYVGAYQTITIRFLGINTPESTGRVEAWGKAASSFVKETLADATSIVLEAEGDRVDSTGNRYLAWVWYRPASSAEYRLLNLEEIELAYSKYTFAVESKYHNTCLQAHEKARLSEKRVWGETDPNFNYSKEIVQTSLLYMLQNHDEFQSGTKFRITVQLIRTNGNNMFLQDAYEDSFDDDGEVVSGKGAVYAFYGYSLAYYRYYKIGDIFELTCQLEYQGDYGTQLTGLADASAVIENSAPEIPVLEADDLDGGAGLEPYYGAVVQLNNLECVKISAKTTGSGEDYYVVEAKNSNGEMFDIYFGNSVITPYNVEEVFEVGKIYNIIGGVAFYQYANGQYQLSVGDAPRYNGDVLNPEDQARLYDVMEVE
ncbi:MAG: thermonuclease family protein [Bacilli bacterium]|jgi:micrococcal nuclease|nr:thermonuclease family protein [Bacilli bacterium]MDY0063712.1 thermonuclease family protein [Bacilli bacterium]